MSRSILAEFSVDRFELYDEFHRIRSATGLTFLLSAIIGTIIILIVVRGIVKPIKCISKASKEVAKGNFDIEVKIKSKDEIGQLTADFNLMTKELKNIDFLRKDFVSNVSHEFKTTITSIKGFAKLIREGQLSDDQISEYSGIIVNESDRLSLLSSNLLKLSELDSKMIREQATVFSLDEQIRKTILILETQWSKKEIEFDIELDEIVITADKHLLQEVWLNLIQNAIKFSSDKGIIKIILHKNGDMAKAEIADYGIGITDDDKGRIFERFYKSDKSRSKEGNGLGLVIVKKIVELSDGKIYFESKSGKGSTFTVELPL
jgi:signal transduction histidine kinase